MSKSERLEWVRTKPTLTGTPWENFKRFLLKTKDEYEETAKTGTTGLEEEVERKEKKCTNCKRSKHVEEDCWLKKTAGGNKSAGGDRSD